MVGQNENESFDLFLNEIRNDNPRFQYELDVTVSIFLNEEQGYDPAKLTRWLRKQRNRYKKSTDHYLKLSTDNSYSAQIKENTHKAKSYEILIELHEHEKLIPLIHYRRKLTNGKYPKSEIPYVSKPNIDRDNEFYKNGILDLLEIALAFTSPVSAARYIINKVKDNN